MREAKQFQLRLESGETVTCSSCGNGPRIAYIPGGPGSFYFKGLPLQDYYTYVASDSAWTYRKSSDSFFTQKKPETMTLEGIKKHDYLVVKALKNHFEVDEIDGFGFSAPGAFVFELENTYPGLFGDLIGTGIGLTPLDPTFAKTNAFFKAVAEPERIKKFEEHQEKYKDLLTKGSSGGYKDVLAFFDFKPGSDVAKIFQDKPHRQFLAESMTMAVKLFFNFSDMEDVRLKLKAHWEDNPFGEHVNKKAQEHFFNEIFPKLKPLQTIIELANKGKKIKLIYGEADFITPLPYDILETLATHPTGNISLHILPRCGHVPYVESPKEYAEVVRSKL